MRTEVGQDMIGIARDPVTRMKSCRCPPNPHGSGKKLLQACGRGEPLLPVRPRRATAGLGHRASRSGAAEHRVRGDGRDRDARRVRARACRREPPGPGRPSRPIAPERSRRQWPRASSLPTIRPRSRPESKRVGERRHPLVDRFLGQDMDDEVRGGLHHASGATARAGNAAFAAAGPDARCVPCGTSASSRS